MPNKFVNTFPSMIIRSPLHAIMSSKYAIIEFRGRKSGRIYRTPVAYVRDGDRILMSTDSPWYRNVAGGAPVRMVVRGRTVVGTADTVTDADASAAILRKLVDAIPSYSRPAGLAREEGRVSDAEIRRAIAAGRVSIEIRLDAPS
jgi:deazaflavin-dependent oxidoreductase (nitroreductase family)